MMPAAVHMPTPPAAPAAAPGVAGGMPAPADDNGAFGRELQRLTDSKASAQGNDAAGSAAPWSARRPTARSAPQRSERDPGSANELAAAAVASDAPAAATLAGAEQSDGSATAPDAAPAGTDLGAWMAGLLNPQDSARSAGASSPRDGSTTARARAVGSAVESEPGAGGDGARAARSAAMPGRAGSAPRLDDTAPALAPARGTGEASAKPGPIDPAGPTSAQIEPTPRGLPGPTTGPDPRPDAPRAQEVPTPAAGVDATTRAWAAQAAPAATATAQPVPPAIVELALRTPLTSPGFGAAFGTQISVLARDGVEHARLHLNPAEMGPIAVQVAVDGRQVRVDLVAEMGATRQLLEQSLPMLASALRDAGFTLTGGGVFQQQRDAGASGGGHAEAGAPGRTVTDSDGPDAAAQPPRTRTTLGLVDLFA